MSEQWDHRVAYPQINADSDEWNYSLEEAEAELRLLNENGTRGPYWIERRPVGKWERVDKETP